MLYQLYNQSGLALILHGLGQLYMESPTAIKPSADSFPIAFVEYSM